MRRLGGQDLDDVAVLQRGVEAGHAPVDLGADAVVADLGVDAVGEIDRGAAGGQAAHLALGGEDEDLLLEDVDLEVVDEVLGIEQVLLPLHQEAEPAELLVGPGVGLAALLVMPVSRHADLGGLVHLVGADLDLHRVARVRHDRGVQ